MALLRNKSGKNAPAAIFKRFANNMEKSKIKAGERANVGQPIFRPLGKTKTATELPSQREKKNTEMHAK